MNRLAIGGLAATFLTASAAAETPLDVLGETVTIKVSGQETDGAVSVVEVHTPPGLGAPPHANSREVIVFYVAEGTVAFTVEGETVEKQQGVVVLIPRGVMHGYVNVGDAPSRLVITFAPGGFERFFDEVHERQFELPDDMQAFVELATKYGMELGAPPEEE